MGHRYQNWIAESDKEIHDIEELKKVISHNREFSQLEKLDYGNHGLLDALELIHQAIEAEKKIALYADYDVDGTMSCVSWIWYLEAIGYSNFTYYIPDRFTEGYGVNLNAVKYLVKEHKAELIITMDTGITANIEAQWCKQQGVDFICTDHHKIQADKMPDCIILNPKTHPDPVYQELCGCGITFVLLRKLAEKFPISSSVWQDLMAITGMATICDIVPLNAVNHKLARLGVKALLKSQRPVLKKILAEASVHQKNLDEQDIGFRLGPRINAVGRLDHAHKVIEAFTGKNVEDLVQFMGACNEERKNIQNDIIEKARTMAKEYENDPILFLGGDWHQGVVGIAASRICEENWKPTWLFEKKEKQCKGSARSIPGFDVTNSMAACSKLFEKFGGHSAAAGFAFHPSKESDIRKALIDFANKDKQERPEQWQSCIHYDCSLALDLINYTTLESLSEFRPFGFGFSEPIFLIKGKVSSVKFLINKNTGEQKHTSLSIERKDLPDIRIIFFNDVFHDIQYGLDIKVLASISKTMYRGMPQISVIGKDFEIFNS